MAPGSTLTYRVEIEFTPGSGTYVDLSDRVTELTIVRPAGTRLGEASTTTVDVSFLNHPASPAEITAWGTTVGAGYCPLSPESPAAAFYPQITRDRMIKVTAVWAGGASTAIRFWGWINSWTPDAGTNPPTTATVSLSASCILSRYARRQLLSQYGEYNMQNPDLDYWPLNEPASSRVFKGYAQAGQNANDAKLILPWFPPGKSEIQEPDGGHATDGQIQFTRGDGSSYPSPVLVTPLRSNRSTFSTFEAWFRLDVDPTGSSDDALTAYNGFGQLWWRLTAGIVSGKVEWTIYDNTGVARSIYATGSPRDGGWHFLFLMFPDATTSNIYYSNRGNRSAGAAGTIGLWGYDPRSFDYMIVGGRMAPTRSGKISNTLQGAISSYRIGYNGYVTSGQGYNDSGTPITSDTHKNLLISSGLGVDAAVGGAVSTSGDTRPIQPTRTYPGLLDRWNEFARTNLSELITRTDGRRQYSALAVTRKAAVSLTLDAEQDLSAPDGGWQPIKDESPTRVQVTSPVGTVSYTQTAVEASTGMRLDAPTIDTANGDDTGMRTVAAFATIQTGTRLRSFGFDPTITSTDKLTAAMALQPRDRVRVTNIPAALTGQTYIDVFAYGWTERFNANDGSCGWTFETWLADDPPEGVYDDAEYGRWALGDGATTVTSGTAVGTTAVGTLVLTGVTLTTDPTSYPLDLDWAGERVTVTAAPGSSASPQTVTLTARGVAPTVARVHVAGDPVEIWHADRFGV